MKQTSNAEFFSHARAYIDTRMVRAFLLWGLILGLGACAGKTAKKSQAAVPGKVGVLAELPQPVKKGLVRLDDVGEISSIRMHWVTAQGQAETLSLEKQSAHLDRSDGRGHYALPWTSEKFEALSADLAALGLVQDYAPVAGEPLVSYMTVSGKGGTRKFKTDARDAKVRSIYRYLMQLRQEAFRHGL